MYGTIPAALPYINTFQSADRTNNRSKPDGCEVRLIDGALGGKSSEASIEPEWEGHVTLEFSNTTNLPARIYANEGAAQMVFFQSDEYCEVFLQ